MDIISIDQILSMPRCDDYPDSRVRELFAGRAAVTIEEIALAPIPAKDRVWVLIQLLDERRQRLFACDCAERALTRKRTPWFEPDVRSFRVVDVARAYARGLAPAEELDAARDLAEYAEEAAHRAADAVSNAWAANVFMAAWCAARAAQSTVIWDAADSATRSAKEAAAERCADFPGGDRAREPDHRWATRARDAERDWQIERLVEYVINVDGCQEKTDMIKRNLRREAELRVFNAELKDYTDSITEETNNHFEAMRRRVK